MSSSSSQSSRGKCSQISLDEIEEATNNFAESNVVGHGGEGKVYLAQIKLGWKLTQVAVKHLKPNSQEFDKEIKTISKIQHPNLVSLLGYCNESGQKILLYEFMEKGSLADYVTKKSEISLSWLQRIGICLDAARGLQHLHIETDENPKGIIHRDVKPGNILLGKDWVAKISDFGMVKLSDADQVKSTMVTGLKGTGGYYAPEYVKYQSVTRKIDVYAFGVVLFQVLCLKMPWDRGDESYYGMEEEDLGIWAHQNVDPIIKPNVSDDSLKEFTAIVGKSLKCDPRKRPTMDGVVLGLEKVLKFQEREYEAKKGRAAEESTEQHSTAGSRRGSSRSIINRPFEIISSGIGKLLSKEKGRAAKESTDHLKTFGWTTGTKSSDIVYTPNVSSLPNLNLGLKLPFAEIQQATKNFNPKLVIGEGGFGKVKVYKGVLTNGVKVAVKRSEPGHGQGLPEFQKEIMVLSRIRHKYIVSLIGYCDERSEMILVHEFMERGTLREHLYGSDRDPGCSRMSSLPWNQRLEICIGAAWGLNYLHTGAGGIIHRNVKSTNILLDEHYVAKVAGFGISRLGPVDPSQNRVSTELEGSFGYLDPEYYRCQNLTQKSDVYSFGVVLLEVLCARPPLNPLLPREEINLAEWGISWIQKGEVGKIVDPTLVGKINPSSLRKFGETVEKCLKEYGDERPSMMDVVWDLQYSLQLHHSTVVREAHEDSTINDDSWDIPMHAIHRLPSRDVGIDDSVVSDESVNTEGNKYSPFDSPS